MAPDDACAAEHVVGAGLAKDDEGRLHGARNVHEMRADTEALAQRGLGYEHLDQLALEYLYGVRP